MRGIAMGTIESRRSISLFKERQKRSRTAMLPCFPTAPYLGLAPFVTHHATYAPWNCAPRSLTMWRGARPAFFRELEQVDDALGAGLRSPELPRDDAA
ncbi:hypothetical protein BH09MYX1_BH09MYX1_66180 [soil metagenome]